MIVRFGDEFSKEVKNFPKEDRTKILEFITHVMEHGFNGLKGRNKPSHNESMQKWGRQFLITKNKCFPHSF